MEGTALSLAASPGNPGSDSDTICPVNPLSGPVSSARECLGLWVSWCHFNLLQLPGDQFTAFVIFWLSHPILFFLLFLAVRSLKFNLVYYLGTSWGRSWDNHSWVQSTKLPGPCVCACGHSRAHLSTSNTHVSLWGLLPRRDESTMDGSLLQKLQEPRQVPSTSVRGLRGLVSKEFSPFCFCPRL